MGDGILWRDCTIGSARVMAGNNYRDRKKGNFSSTELDITLLYISDRDTLAEIFTHGYNRKNIVTRVLLIIVHVHIILTHSYLRVFIFFYV